LENVMLPLQYNNVFAPSDRVSRAQKILTDVGLSDRIGSFPSQLSGGQQQKVAIARALICDPAIVLADEPTGNLDSKSGEQIMTILQDLNKKGKTVIVVTHDANIAQKTKRIVSMKDGVIVSDTRKKQ